MSSTVSPLVSYPLPLMPTTYSTMSTSDSLTSRYSVMPKPVSFPRGIDEYTKISLYNSLYQNVKEKQEYLLKTSQFIQAYSSKLSFPFSTPQTDLMEVLNSRIASCPSSI